MIDGGVIMIDEKSFQRSGYLKIVNLFVQVGWFMSWVATLLLMILIVASYYFDFQVKFIQIPVEVHFENIEDNPLNSSSGLDIVSFSNPRIQTDKIEYFNSLYSIPLILVIGMIMVFFYLRKFISNVKAGKPFDKENPKYLKIIGIIIACSGPFYGISNYIYGKIYVSSFTIPGALIIPDKNMHGDILLVGLIIVIIARVLEVGVNLKQDQELTI